MNEPDQENELESQEVIESPQSVSKDVDIKSIEIGDVILIHANRNTNIDQQTYYVYYVDELKLKL